MKSGSQSAYGNINNMQRHPPKYEKVKDWVKTQASVTISQIETKFNLRYKESREILKVLQDEGYLSTYGNARGEYRRTGELWG